MNQYNLSFEFNEDFLILLFDNAYVSEFGTFLGTCDLDRDKLFLSDRKRCQQIVVYEVYCISSTKVIFSIICFARLLWSEEFKSENDMINASIKSVTAVAYMTLQ